MHPLNEDWRSRFSMSAARSVLNAIAEVSEFDAMETTPERIGDYVVEDALGSGGGGTVMKVVRDGSVRPVALKLLAERLDHSLEARRAWRELDFLEELQLAAVPRLLDYGVHEGRLYIVTELIQGSSLDEHCAKEELDRESRLELVARVADCVQELHEHGILHRDIKPGNVLVNQSGSPVLIDLGIASLLSADGQRTITRDGVPIGSPSFMAPEQSRGDRAAISTRSDVYSLGATAYMILLGEPPHDLDVPLHEAIRRVAQDPPRDPLAVDPRCPKPLAAILRHAVHADPAQRYESAAAFAADLRRWLRHEPVDVAEPGMFTRLRQVFRTHPVSATTLTVLLPLVSAALTTLAIVGLPSHIIELADIKRGRVAFDGDYARSQFSGAAAVGDVNGDGIDDVLIAAPHRPKKSVNPWIRQAGMACLHLGPIKPRDGSVVVDSSRTVTIFGGEWDNLGARVASAGDLNGDGFADMMLAAPGLDSEPGYVAVLFGNARLSPGVEIDVTRLDGSNGLRIEAPMPSATFGMGLAALGDLSGDGIDDIAIGDGTPDGGRVWIVFGSETIGDTGTLELTSLTGSSGRVLKSPESKALFGESIDGGTDCNDDGVLDLIIGAPSSNKRAGAVYVVSGRHINDAGIEPDLTALDGIKGFVMSGDEPEDVAGCSVAFVDDVNGDMIPDFLVGAFGIGNVSSDGGKAHLVLGSRSPRPTIDLGSEALTFYGKRSPVGEGDWVGRQVSSAGDFNGDGTQDLAIAAVHANPNGNNSGAVYVILGSAELPAVGRIELNSEERQGILVIHGAENGDEAGSRLAPVPDLDGDGRDELFIGLPKRDPGGATDAGQVILLFGIAR